MKVLFYGTPLGRIVSQITNGVFRRGDPVVVKPGRVFGGEIGVVYGFTHSSTLVALDWPGVTHPFGNDDIVAA